MNISRVTQLHFRASDARCHIPGSIHSGVTKALRSHTSTPDASTDTPVATWVHSYCLLLSLALVSAPYFRFHVTPEVTYRLQQRRMDVGMDGPPALDGRPSCVETGASRACGNSSLVHEQHACAWSAHAYDNTSGYANPADDVIDCLGFDSEAPSLTPSPQPLAAAARSGHIRSGPMAGVMLIQNRQGGSSHHWEEHQLSARPCLP